MLIYGAVDFTVGAHSYIGPQSLINADEDVHIGNRSALGPRCMVFMHGSFFPYTEGYWVKFSRVAIDDNVWCAAGVFIHPGIEIGNDVFVNSRSVLAQDFPSGAVMEGFPARPATQVPPSPTSSSSIIPTIPLSSPAPPPPLDQASVGGAPVPSAHLPSPITVLQQVAAAEAALRTGQFEAAIDYGNQNRSSAHLRFDLGDDRRAPRLHIVSQYQSASSAHIIERITIGDRSWQREIDGRWTARPAAEGVWDQVVPFLPHAGSVTSAAIAGSGNPLVLRWYDAGRDADITLVVDLASGIPLELRQTSRTTGLVLSVNYRGWNTPVEITPPEES